MQSCGGWSNKAMREKKIIMANGDGIRCEADEKKNNAEKPTTHKHSKSNHLCQEKEYGA